MRPPTLALNHCAVMLPSDFCHQSYRKLNWDLAHLSDDQLEEHWLNQGHIEGRRYRGPSRSEQILAGKSKADRGLEIAPYFCPIAPKRQGYNVQTVDVFDRPTLEQRAAEDPNIPDIMIANIEDVDFVGSAGYLRQLIGDQIPAASLDYILSSHNFEHLPNPLRFLQDCEHYLAPTGLLSMAIPDLRCCFDFFQWPTMLEEWLWSEIQEQQQPSAVELFRASCRLTNNFGYLNYPHEQIALTGDLLTSFQQLLVDAGAVEPGEYRDTHRSFFTPSSFRLLLSELQYLGLTGLEIVQLTGPIGNEFIVQLAPASTQQTWVAPEEFGRQRRQLLVDIIDEISLKSPRLRSSSATNSSTVSASASP
ncbi:MAG: methyltransferase domain-containing protein [Synechococcaceae cyanobacterium]|nr:methyltransferase domain-containing protein [Synechococcaceae cyanobacterium]